MIECRGLALKAHH